MEQKKRVNREGTEKREERKSKTSTVSFFVCLGISIVLMVGSAIMPPPFVIDASIFNAVGWLFGFAALGQLPAVLNTDKWAKISHGQTTVLVGDKDDMDRKPHHRPQFNEYQDVEIPMDYEPDDDGTSLI